MARTEQRGTRSREQRATGALCRRLQDQAEGPRLFVALGHLRAETHGTPQPMAGGAQAKSGRPEQGAA